MKRKYSLIVVLILIGIFICPEVYAEELTADQRWEKIFNTYEKTVDTEEESYTFELTKNLDPNIYDVKFVDKEDTTIAYTTQIKRVDNYAIVEFKDNLTEKEGTMIFAALMNMQTLFLMAADYDVETVGNIILGVEKIKSGLEESNQEYTYSYKNENAEFSITYPAFIKYDLENGVVLEEKDNQEETEVPNENGTQAKPEIPSDEESQNGSSGEGKEESEKPKEEEIVVKVPDTLAKTSKISKVLGMACILIGMSVLLIYTIKNRKNITQ